MTTLHRPSSWIGKFAVAGAGIWRTCRTQSSMKVHLVATAGVIALSIWTGLSPLEWAILLLVIGLVIGMELLNTAVEAVVDLATDEYAEFARTAKDAASGGVLVAAITAVGVAGCLFLPHWLAGWSR